jgi:ABC-type glutathione transport system ATPase component
MPRKRASRCAPRTALPIEQTGRRGAGAAAGSALGNRPHDTAGRKRLKHEEGLSILLAEQNSAIALQYAATARLCSRTEYPFSKATLASCGSGRTFALHDVSLKLRQGEILALLGANAGKTTTLKALSNLLPVVRVFAFYLGAGEPKPRATFASVAA